MKYQRKKSTQIRLVNYYLIYYYDKETGFYYLKSRYYDPAIRRFVSADSMNVLMVATNTVNNKNLFTYAENNPVNGKDAGGGAVETVFDIVSLAGSVVDVYCNPMDPWAQCSSFKLTAPYHMPIFPIANFKNPQRSPLRLRFLKFTLRKIFYVNGAVI